jgi:hypothetical protein
MSKIDFLLSGINTIYETNNVYQAIVLLSNNDDVVPLRDALLAAEYPVSTKDDIQRFLDASTRLFITTPTELATYADLDLLLARVNAVIATEAFPILTTMLYTNDPKALISHYILS